MLVVVVVVLFVPPVPVLLLLVGTALLEVPILAVGVVLPLRVVRLLGRLNVMVMIVGIVDTGVYRASGGEYRHDDSSGKQDWWEPIED